MITALLNLGTHQDDQSEVAKRTRIANAITVFTVVILIVMTAVGFVVQETTIGLMGLILSPIVMLPLIFNLKGLYLAARLHFLISSYVIICAISIIFGPDLHYHFFLLPGIGMVFIFLEARYVIARIILSIIAVPLFVGLVLYHQNFEPLVLIEESSSGILALMNDIMMFATIFMMFSVYARQNYLQVQALKKQQEEIRRVNQELDQFAYIASHDLKSPLRAISSLVSIIEEDYSEKLDPEVAQHFDLIKSRTIRMDGLIDSILRYSRSDKSEEHEESFDPENEVIETINLLEVGDEVQIGLSVESQALFGHKTQFGQVISNLVTNAIKYNDKPSKQISIKSEIDDDRMIIRVQDNGPGIDPVYHKKIFDPFVMMADDKRDSTGIGLAIVKKLVEKNKGDLGIESKLGEGSTFWFSWPLDFSKK